MGDYTPRPLHMETAGGLFERQSNDVVLAMEDVTYQSAIQKALALINKTSAGNIGPDHCFQAAAIAMRELKKNGGRLIKADSDTKGLFFQPDEDSVLKIMAVDLANMSRSKRLKNALSGTEECVPKESDVVVSLHDLKYKDKMFDLFRKLGHDRIPMNETTEIAEKIVQEFKNEAANGLLETRFFKQHQYTKEYYLVDENEALSKIQSDITRRWKNSHRWLSNGSPQGSHWEVNTQAFAMQLLNGARSDLTRLIKQKNHHNLFYNDKMDHDSHRVIRFVRNLNFNAKGLDRVARLAIIGQHCAKLLLESKQSCVIEFRKEEKSSPTPIYITYTDGDLKGAKEGINKFTGYPALAQYMYREGLYESEVVKTEDGVELLKAIGIHKHPFNVFSEEMGRSRSTDAGEMKDIKEMSKVQNTSKKVNNKHGTAAEARKKPFNLEAAKHSKMQDKRSQAGKDGNGARPKKKPRRKKSGYPRKRSGWNVFLTDLKKSGSAPFVEFSRFASTAWKALSEEERMEYQHKADGLNWLDEENSTAKIHGDLGKQDFRYADNQDSLDGVCHKKKAIVAKAEVQHSQKDEKEWQIGQDAKTTQGKDSSQSNEEQNGMRGESSIKDVTAVDEDAQPCQAVKYPEVQAEQGTHGNVRDEVQQESMATHMETQTLDDANHDQPVEAIENSQSDQASIPQDTNSKPIKQEDKDDDYVEIVEPAKSYFFQVIISNCADDTTTMVEVPRSDRDLTFEDLRRVIENQILDELPFASFRFSLKGGNGSKVLVRLKQEKMWCISNSNFGLMTQGDGSWFNPYRVYLQEAN